jgi:hypothetical protein
MTPQPNSNWQQRLNDLENEVNSQDPPIAQVYREEAFSWKKQMISWLEPQLKQITKWFNEIPSTGKLAVVGVSAIVGLMLLKTVFQLITSLITLGVIGVGLYLIYKFWILPKSNQP